MRTSRIKEWGWPRSSQLRWTRGEPRRMMVRLNLVRGKAMQTRLGGRSRTAGALGVVLVLLVSVVASLPASASTAPTTIVLPGATSAEGIAAGRGSTFYAGDIFTGDIFRGDVRRGTAEPFIDAPAGRQAAGMWADVSRDLLFVAGGFTGQAYVYDLSTGAPLASYQLGGAGPSLINDVAVTRDGAWFTDTVQPRLYFVPVGPRGQLGAFTTLALSGPAADSADQFNLNGIRATPDGSTLIVAHTGNAALYTVDPDTGASQTIAGVSVPNVDGILFEAGRLWAVQNFINQVSRIRLSPDLTSGVVEEVITDPRFQVPATAARFGDRLAVLNAKFDTGFPPTATQFEVVVVER